MTRPRPTYLTTETPLWVVGDVHGAYEKLVQLLRQAGLIDEQTNWTGKRAHLVFLGDYFDRGPDGIGVVRLIRKLEAQALQTGGQVTALLGNHEVMILAALLFSRLDARDEVQFRRYWLSNGGRESDLEQLDGEDCRWLLARPAMIRVGDWLLLHADSTIYNQLGGSIEEVNASAHSLLFREDAEAWGIFANTFAERLLFTPPDGEAQARAILQTFGGRRIVHGHTPVYILLDEMNRVSASGTGHPLLYAGQLCCGLDSGMAYREEAGFMVRLDDDRIANVVSFSLPKASAFDRLARRKS